MLRCVSSLDCLLHAVSSYRSQGGGQSKRCGFELNAMDLKAAHVSCTHAGVRFADDGASVAAANATSLDLGAGVNTWGGGVEMHSAAPAPKSRCLCACGAPAVVCLVFGENEERTMGVADLRERERVHACMHACMGGWVSLLVLEPEPLPEYFHGKGLCACGPPILFLSSTHAFS